MTLRTAYLLILIVLIILLFALLPPLGLHTYGWAPTSALTVILVVLLVLVLLGRL